MEIKNPRSVRVRLANGDMIENIRKNRGFTLVEVMIVVTVMALLISIIIMHLKPMRDRARKNACVINLDHIESAKTIWLIDHPTYTRGDITMDDLVPDYIRKTPVCPGGGEYTVGDMNTYPVCSVEDHQRQ